MSSHLTSLSLSFFGEKLCYWQKRHKLFLIHTYSESEINQSDNTALFNRETNNEIFALEFLFDIPAYKTAVIKHSTSVTNGRIAFPRKTNIQTKYDLKIEKLY